MPGPSLRIPRVSGLVMGQPGGGAPTPNPNLLLWSEEMQQAVWTKNSVTVTADAATHPEGGATADLLEFGAGGSIYQAAFAAVSGDPVGLGIVPGAEWVRESVTGTFDGTVYVLSVEVRDPLEAAATIHLRLFRLGGMLQAGFVDLGEEAPSFECFGWKLETPNLTDYVKREGV